MITPDPATRPSILLTKGNYLGTLAIARWCAKRGYTTILADPSTTSLTHASRYLSAAATSPPVGDFDEFARWLVHFGERHPDSVLYPSGDDMAWLISYFQDDLAHNFRLYSPKIDVVFSLLNKSLLYKISRSLDIPIPNTYAPISFQEVSEIASAIQYPVLIKPRTHVGMLRAIKGKLCTSKEELKSAYKRIRERTTYHSRIVQNDAHVMWPLIQTYFESASRDTYSVSGFVDHTQRVFLVRAASKVLQMPLRVGIGLCFESRPVDRTCVSRLKSLCSHIGYHGVFEAEFVSVDGDFLLTDFNPRFYGQIGFEIARGLPLDELICAYASGNQSRGDEVQTADQRWNHEREHRYCNRWRMKTLLATQRCVGHVSGQEQRRWHVWAERVGDHFDPVFWGNDPGPRRADIFSVVRNSLRHPRSSFATFFLDV